ncbi:uncharacterized protein LOC122385916 [Amphibalanus amphitrite]|uniref:uncharacterized protein LOC122385916 n=1 Tax=Amphibalanus amphitrite TaxID=1232801 RepID=UPI001C9122C6|nr:uncharacterized protein LOC122385916 [Amphibalanus amphitrite]
MNSQLVVLAALLAVAVAMPRYVLVPVEELEHMPPHVRVARQAPLPVEQADASDRYERQTPGGYDGGLQVDYGAYTGKKGAFGWYADYPVYSYGRH